MPFNFRLQSFQYSLISQSEDASVDMFDTGTLFESSVHIPIPVQNVFNVPLTNGTHILTKTTLINSTKANKS